MSIWLFYKEKSVSGGVEVEFRRLQDKQLSSVLPEKLCGKILIPTNENTEQYVQTLVRQSGWVAQPPRPANSELGQALLQGRW